MDESQGALGVYILGRKDNLLSFPEGRYRGQMLKMTKFNQDR